MTLSNTTPLENIFERAYSLIFLIEINFFKFPTFILGSWCTLRRLKIRFSNIPSNNDINPRNLW